VFDPACDERVCALVTHGVKRVSLSRCASRVALALEHDLRRAGATLAVPTLFVRGERDTAFVVEQERHLAMLIPGVASSESPKTPDICIRCQSRVARRHDHALARGVARVLNARGGGAKLRAMRCQVERSTRGRRLRGRYADYPASKASARRKRSRWKSCAPQSCSISKCAYDVTTADGPN
jgi:hypothetical protein